MNTGAFDPLDAIADITRRHRAWLHVDGAFGLWAAASGELKHHVGGVERGPTLSGGTGTFVRIGVGLLGSPFGLNLTSDRS